MTTLPIESSIYQNKHLSVFVNVTFWSVLAECYVMEVFCGGYVIAIATRKGIIIRVF